MLESKEIIPILFPKIKNENLPAISLYNSVSIEKSIEKFRQTKINSILPVSYRQRKFERHLWTNSKIGIILRKPTLQIKVIEKLPKIQYLSSDDETHQSITNDSVNRKTRKTSIDYQDKILFLKLSNKNIAAEERALMKTNNNSFCRYKVDCLRKKAASSLESIPEYEYHDFSQTDSTSRIKYIDWRQPWSGNFMSSTPTSSKPSSLPTISE